MIFGLPKGSFKHANQPYGPSVTKGKWCRLFIAGNLPDYEYFAEEIRGNSPTSIALNRDDFLAIVKVAEDGMLTYMYELTDHSPGDWAEFNLLSEVGEPYQHLFSGIKSYPLNIDWEPYCADFLCPFSTLSVEKP